jgi:hypothetical protein
MPVKEPRAQPRDGILGIAAKDSITSEAARGAGAHAAAVTRMGLKTARCGLTPNRSSVTSRTHARSKHVLNQAVKLGAPFAGEWIANREMNRQPLAG